MLWSHLLLSCISGQLVQRRLRFVTSFCPHRHVLNLAGPLILAAMSDLHSAFNHKLKKFCYFRLIMKKPHKLTAELRFGQWKGYYMEHCGSGTKQPVNKFKMADRWMKLQETLDMTQHCSVFGFP